MILVNKNPRGAICTVDGCEPLKALRWSAVIWCPRCGSGRCEAHREVPGGRCCGNAPAHDALAAGEHKEEGSDAAAGTPSPEAPGDG
jgi:hypothetical protein